MSFGSKYQLSYPLNSGRFGTVYKANHLVENKTYAVKVLPKNRMDFSRSKTQSMINNEIKNNMLLKGKPHIVELKEIINDQEHVYFVQEYCENGDLEAFAKNQDLTEENVSSILRQVCLGIRSCNEEGLVMCDIKPSNIVIDSLLNFKLCDFGCSQNCTNLYNGLTNGKGTILFMAPEVLQGSYGKLCDIYSVGIMAHRLITKEYPYEEANGSSTSLLIDAIRQRKLVISEKMSTTALDFVVKCTEHMKKRPTLEEVLTHPFLYKKETFLHNASFKC